MIFCKMHLIFNSALHCLYVYTLCYIFWSYWIILLVKPFLQTFIRPASPFKNSLYWNISKTCLWSWPKGISIGIQTVPQLEICPTEEFPDWHSHNRQLLNGRFPKPLVPRFDNSLTRQLFNQKLFWLNFFLTDHLPTRQFHNWIRKGLTF